MSSRTSIPRAARWRVHLLAALAVVLLGCVPASAEVRIMSSPGGPVLGFLALFQELRATGERVVIDGPCYSACTLVLTTVPANRICVTRRAVLGFHGARSVDRYGHIAAEPEASKIILDSYPVRVRNWIDRHGGLTSHILFLRGRELAGMFPHCR